jgi:signal transduction histidine kinase/ActR/RegA family two-component response regulator
MVSCVAPAYPDGGTLRGVVGLDVTVSRLAEHLGVNGNRDPILLVSSDGAVLVTSTGAAELLGAGAPRLDASAAGREVAAAVATGAEGSRIVGERHIVWRRIAETGWTLIHLFPRRESYEELEQRSRVLGLAQRLLSRGAADVAAVAARTTREALDAEATALWWTEGLRFRRVAADGGGESLGPATFAAVPETMAAAAATPGRATGAGTARLDLALGSPGQTLGFLAVRRSAEFTDDDARFFELIGYTAALGLENVAQFRRLAQAQKMEGLGAVAAAVAHDFNNLLGSILGNASLLRLSVPQVDEHTRRLIDIIESSAERGAALTRQLLQFTRGGAPKREVVAVSTLFTDALAFIRQSLPKNIRVEVVLPAALPAVEIDRVQMEQVLVNLCINARDAMPQGGVLVLEASAESPPAELASSAAGRWVAMEVRDTGVGMAPEVLDRVFDPFFTTKPLGQGTGLGLPIAHRIVRDHQGVIDLMSEPGRGTTVRVYLPATGLEPAVPAAGAPEAIRTGHGELILVVDDEPAVLAVVTDALHQAGYAPLAASSGPEALRLASSRKADLRLMVLDLLMPEMSGIELLRKIRAIAPELRVLVTSGYVQPSVEPALMELGVDGILDKPFTSAALLERVRRALAEKGSGKRTPTPKIRMSPKRENRPP